MAHTCPDCGLMCHCGGDIGDCLFDFDEDVDQCKHCPVHALEDDYDDDLEGESRINGYY